jgi:anaerobic magnesium-protoporphyrin IX monomethyl ester cyclase
MPENSSSIKPVFSFHHLLINQNGQAHSPPLGVLTLIEVLRKQNKPAFFFQFTHRKGEVLCPQRLAQQISDSPGIAAISTMINGLPLLIMALRILKKTSPEKQIIVGGPGFTGIAFETIEHFPEIDIVCFGEGEIQILQLYEYFEGKRNLENVTGICFRNKQKGIKTEQTHRITDLDLVPPLCFDAFSLKDYGGFPIMASRGCPFKCSFCDVAPSWGRRNTRRTIEHVIDELDFLYYEKGLRNISFVDDLFIVNQKWTEAFCKEKIRRKNKMIWRANGHINLTNENLISLMAEAGCESIFFGVESGSNQVLKKIDKNFTIEKAKNVLHFTSTYMNANINLIWGYPFETTQDLNKTLDAQMYFIENKIGCSLVMLAPLQSAPITEQYPATTLNLNYPNIFLSDYYELDKDFKPQFHELLRTHPKIFSAFYCFDSPLLEYHDALVQFYQLSQMFENKFPSPTELWEGV